MTTEHKPQMAPDRFSISEIKPGLWAIWDRQLRFWHDSDRDEQKVRLVADILNKAERDGTLGHYGLSIADTLEHRELLQP